MKKKQSAPLTIYVLTKDNIVSEILSTDYTKYFTRHNPEGVLKKDVVDYGTLSQMKDIQQHLKLN